MIDRLDQAIRAVFPELLSVRLNQDGTIETAPPADAAAQSVIDSFDWSQVAHDAWLEDQKPERKAIRQAAAQAIADNDAFLAIGSPTNAQTLAQVRRLTQQNNRIIRRLIQLD